MAQDVKEQTPVVSGARLILAHAPGMVRHGSKPMRELDGNPDLAEELFSSLRTFEEAVAYALGGEEALPPARP